MKLPQRRVPPAMMASGGREPPVVGREALESTALTANLRAAGDGSIANCPVVPSSEETGQNANCKLTDSKAPHALRATQDGGEQQMTSDHGQRTISACIFALDNERTNRACITSVMPWVDEVIVVDTGSTDRTPDICRSLGCRVYHMTWPDSFAAARNESLEYATSKWVFVIDTDDVLDEANGRLLRELVNNAPPEVMAYIGRNNQQATINRVRTIYENRSDPNGT
jgi:hypothetical protein